MIHIMRIDEMAVWHGKDFFDFSQLSEESNIVNKRKGATYLLSDNMGGANDKWNVAVFVKNVKEEQKLKELCYGGGYLRFNGGDEIYDFGKCEVEGYPKTLSTDEFIKMFNEEEKGEHSLHNYYRNNYIDAIKKTIDGRTFEEWCDEIKQEWLQHDCEEFANDEGFVKHIAEFTWSSVEDDDSDNLLSSLDGCYETLEDEYKLYKERQ